MIDPTNPSQNQKKLSLQLEIQLRNLHIASHLISWSETNLLRISYLISYYLYRIVCVYLNLSNSCNKEWASYQWEVIKYKVSESSQKSEEVKGGIFNRRRKCIKLVWHGRLTDSLVSVSSVSVIIVCIDLRCESETCCAYLMYVT